MIFDSFLRTPFILPHESISVKLTKESPKVLRSSVFKTGTQNQIR